MCPSSFCPCWNFVCLGLAQVIFMLSQLLWVHMYICLAVFGKHSFLEVSHSGCFSLCSLSSAAEETVMKRLCMETGEALHLLCDLCCFTCLQRSDFYENMTLSKDGNLQFWSRAKLSLVQRSNCPKPHSEKWHNFDHNEQKFGRKHNLFLDFTISV